MANEILTPKIIAREALMRLKSNMVMPELVHRDYEQEFRAVGDTVDIRVPATYTVDEFENTINLQDNIEGKVPLKMDIHADISTEVTSKELALDIDRFNERFLSGMVLAMSEFIDTKIAEKAAKGIGDYVGTAGETPDTLKKGFGDPRLALNRKRVPQANRNVVFDPDAESELGMLDVLTKANESGGTQGLREAFMGRVKGFNTYMDQNIATHKAGSYTVLEDAEVVDVEHDQENYNVSILQFESTAGDDEELVAGDLFEVEGEKYVVISDTSQATGGTLNNVKVSPQFHVDDETDLDDDSVTFADQSARGHVSNLAFHQNSIALVNAPLLPPQGGVDAYTAQDPESGLAIRVVWGYDQQTKKEMLSLDTLFGTKVIFPELGVQVLG